MPLAANCNASSNLKEELDEGHLLIAHSIQKHRRSQPDGDSKMSKLNLAHALTRKFEISPLWLARRFQILPKSPDCLTVIAS